MLMPIHTNTNNNDTARQRRIAHTLRANPPGITFFQYVRHHAAAEPQEQDALPAGLLTRIQSYQVPIFSTNTYILTSFVLLITNMSYFMIAILIQGCNYETCHDAIIAEVILLAALIAVMSKLVLQAKAEWDMITLIDRNMGDDFTLQRLDNASRPYQAPVHMATP